MRRPTGSTPGTWRPARHSLRPVRETRKPTSARELAGKSFCHRLCGEIEAAQATAQEALHLVGEAPVWERADLLANLSAGACYCGRFALCDERLLALEFAATRSGNHPALWIHDVVRNGIDSARMGDARASLSRLNQLLGTPFAARCTHWRSTTSTPV